MNTLLNSARKNKQDECYTRYCDIELELPYYHSQLKGKVVYCNCDNPYQSQFVRYFIRNFNTIGLAGLIATSKEAEHGYVLQLNAVPNEYDENELIKSHTFILTGNGDYKSEECISLLKSCDVVITNPPFSLFRDYYNLLKSFKKPFLVIANLNVFMCSNLIDDAINYKIKCGYTHKHGCYFQTPDGEVWIGVACWMTTLDITPHPPLDLTKHLTDGYRTYDGHPEVIDVPYVKDIPMDYFGLMGVPITYIKYYNPNQFKIIDTISSVTSHSLFSPKIDGKTKYGRWVIQRVSTE